MPDQRVARGVLDTSVVIDLDSLDVSDLPLEVAVTALTMAELAAGARFPAKLLRAVGRCADEAAVTRVGISWATEQCADLLHNNVRGIHFYTLNRSDATRQIYQNLGVESSVALRAG